MTDTVLVTYGSTNGSTAQIAEAVAEVLRKDGLTVDALLGRRRDERGVVRRRGGRRRAVRRALAEGRTPLRPPPPPSSRGATGLVLQQRSAGRIGIGTGHPARARCEAGDDTRVRPGARHLRRLSRGRREGACGRDDPPLRQGRRLPELRRDRDVGSGRGPRADAGVGACFKGPLPAPRIDAPSAAGRRAPARHAGPARARAAAAPGRPASMRPSRDQLARDRSARRSGGPRRPAGP